MKEYYLHFKDLKQYYDTLKGYVFWKPIDEKHVIVRQVVPSRYKVVEHLLEDYPLYKRK